MTFERGSKKHEKWLLSRVLRNEKLKNAKGLELKSAKLKNNSKNLSWQNRKIRSKIPSNFFFELQKKMQNQKESLHHNIMG